MTALESGLLEFRATHRHAVIADRKARLVIDVIRGRSVNDALDLLRNDHHRAARLIEKVVASAAANAMQNPSVKASRLVITRALVNGGPLLQGRMRFRPGPMGRYMPFRRRTCHIHVRVADPQALPAEPAAAETAPAESGAGDSTSPDSE